MPLFFSVSILRHSIHCNHRCERVTENTTISIPVSLSGVVIEQRTFIGAGLGVQYREDIAQCGTFAMRLSSLATQLPGLRK